MAAILVSDPLALRRATCPGALPRGRRSPGPPGGRSGAAGPIQTAIRRHMAAGEHASRQGSLHSRGRRWSAQPLEYVTGAACPQVARAIRERRAPPDLTEREQPGEVL